MHGQPRRARLRHAVPNRNGQLDRLVPPLRKVLTPCPPLTAAPHPPPPPPSGGGGRCGGRRGPPPQEQPRPPRADTLPPLGDARGGADRAFAPPAAPRRSARG